MCRHKIPSTLNISLLKPPVTNCAPIVCRAAPSEKSMAGPGLSRCDSFPARIPTVYHLNDSGGHLSPRFIVSATRLRHFYCRSTTAWVIFHWWFSSAPRASLCKTLLSLIRVSGEGIWSLMNETKGRQVSQSDQYGGLLASGTQDEC